jgi:hypothetical protein
MYTCTCMFTNKTIYVPVNTHMYTHFGMDHFETANQLLARGLSKISHPDWEWDSQAISLETPPPWTHSHRPKERCSCSLAMFVSLAPGLAGHCSLHILVKYLITLYQVYNVLTWVCKYLKQFRFDCQTEKCNSIKSNFASFAYNI